MANELSVTQQGSPTLYSILRRPTDGFVWNGSGFVSWSDGSLSTYAISLTPKGGDLFAADLPSGVSKGTYRAFYHEQESGSPATADLILGSELIYARGATSSSPPSNIGDATGYYADGSALEQAFGTESVREWSQLDNESEEADVDRINAALAYADAWIDGYFRGGPYAVPLVPVTAIMTRWATAAAAEWLYRNRGIKDADNTGSKLSELVEAALAEMGSYRDDSRRLNATRADSRMPTCPVVVM
jgi:phage gp36-like protein